jgi:hypothetical protein
MDSSARFGRSNDARVSLGVIKRVLVFAVGLVFASVGLWLLYRNLMFGDVVSVSIVLSAAILVGTGVVLLAPPGPTGKPHSRR